MRTYRITLFDDETVDIEATACRVDYGTMILTRESTTEVWSPVGVKVVHLPYDWKFLAPGEWREVTVVNEG